MVDDRFAGFSRGSIIGSWLFAAVAALRATKQSVAAPGRLQDALAQKDRCENDCQAFRYKAHDLNLRHLPSPGETAMAADFSPDDQVIGPQRMAPQSPDYLAFQMWLAQSKRARWLRDFCVIQ
jgi:hypothetical protein